MSIGPDRVVFPYDLLNGTGTGVTSTGAGPVVVLPPGKKVLQVIIPATSTMSLKIQNSIDGVTWFDVSTSTSGQSYLAEVDSAVPKWRENITAFSSITGTAVAIIAQRMID